MLTVTFIELALAVGDHDVWLNESVTAAPACVTETVADVAPGAVTVTTPDREFVLVLAVTFMVSVFEDCDTVSHDVAFELALHVLWFVLTVAFSELALEVGDHVVGLTERVALAALAGTMPAGTITHRAKSIAKNFANAFFIFISSSFI